MRTKTHDSIFHNTHRNTRWIHHTHRNALLRSTRHRALFRGTHNKYIYIYRHAASKPMHASIGCEAGWPTVGGGGANGHGGLVDPDADARVVVGWPSGKRLAHPELHYVHVRAIRRDNVVRLPHQLRPLRWNQPWHLDRQISLRLLATVPRASAPPPKLCLPVPVPGKKKKER